MGKTRDLFKKIRDTKGTFHAKMGSIKDRNGMDLTEAEDIKKRWQEYTEELYKKDLHTQDNYDLNSAIDPIVKFIDELNNWYIRRSRRRFWILISSCYSLELCIQMGISFLFSFAFCFLSFHSYL